VLLSKKPSSFSRTLRLSLSLVSVAVLTACGGGSSGDGASNAQVELGAALPDQGDYIAVVQQSLSLPESERSGSLTVARSGRATSASSVSYRFIAGTATADTDYRATSGTLNWSAGDTSLRTIDFLVESDVESEADETFSVQLFDVVGIEQLGINDKSVVTINDAPCNTAFPTMVAANTQLSAPCYRLSGSSTVGGAAQLSLSAGTTVIADAQASITIAGNAALNSAGSAKLPVTFKGVNDQPGYWQGFDLESSSALHRVVYTEFNHANDALVLKAGGFAALDNNYFNNNAGAAVVLPLTDANTVGQQNTFTDSAGGIELTGSVIDADQTVHLSAQTTHYVLAHSLVNSGTLSLAAGTELAMADNVSVLVLSSGAVNAVGTQQAPIVIRGLEDAQGYWDGIQYVSSNRADNRFEYTTISNGGGDPARPGNLIVDGLGTRITLQHCALTHSAGYGILYDSADFEVDQLDVVFEQNRLGEQSM